MMSKQNVRRRTAEPQKTKMEAFPLRSAALPSVALASRPDVMRAVPDRT
jgi:hypothetical protein